VVTQVRRDACLPPLKLWQHSKSEALN